MPLGCGSRTLMASWRRASMTSRSCLNMSGCWSYLLLMYCRMTEARDSCVDRRKGSDKMLPVLVPPLLATMLRLCLCFVVWDVTPAQSRGRLVRVKLTSPLGNSRSWMRSLCVHATVAHFYLVLSHGARGALLQEREMSTRPGVHEGLVCCCFLVKSGLFDDGGAQHGESAST